MSSLPTAHTFNPSTLPHLLTTLNTLNITHNITQGDLDYYLASLSASTTLGGVAGTIGGGLGIGGGTSMTASSDGFGIFSSDEYCGTEWTEFRKRFIEFHGVASTVVCAFGLITNMLNIAVLTRRDMTSPTNAILTGLAVADMLVMADYLPFALLTYVLPAPGDSPCARYTYGHSAFVMFHAHLSVVCHTVSIGLTLTLAVWRCVAVCYPQHNRRWCGMRRAWVAILACYAFVPAFCLPVYLSFQISPMSDEEVRGGMHCPGPNYRVTLSDVARENNRLLEKLNFWVYSVLIKIMPCLALTGLSLTLIRALYRANKRRLQLLPAAEASSSSQCDRTTRMLLAVLLLFLVTEVPQGILALLSGLLGEAFFHNCYGNLSEVMDLLALINSAINFILYCAMSRQFRRTFRQLLRPTSRATLLLLCPWSSRAAAPLPAASSASCAVQGNHGLGIGKLKTRPSGHASTSSIAIHADNNSTQVTTCV